MTFYFFRSTLTTSSSIDLIYTLMYSTSAKFVSYSASRVSPSVSLCHFWTWVLGTQPLQLKLFSIRQAQLRHQFFFRQTCSSEIPGNVEFLQEIYQECSINPGPLTNTLKGSGKLLEWTPPLDAAFRFAQDFLAAFSVIRSSVFSLKVEISSFLLIINL